MIWDLHIYTVQQDIIWCFTPLVSFMPHELLIQDRTRPSNYRLWLPLYFHPGTIPLTSWRVLHCMCRETDQHGVRDMTEDLHKKLDWFHDQAKQLWCTIITQLEILHNQRLPLWNEICNNNLRKQYYLFNIIDRPQKTHSCMCSSKYTLSIITSQLHCFQLRTTLNGKDFKFFSHAWAMHREAEHPSSTHAWKIILYFDQ
jgi:hypothetical protein